MMLTVDEHDCDREPIHIPGSIQPHGALLVLSPHDGAILQASENLGEVFGLPAEQVIGREFSAVFGGLAKALESDLARAPIDERPILLRTIDLPQSGRRLQAVAHRNSGGTLLEFEFTAESGLPGEMYSIVDDFGGRAEAETSIDGLCEMLALEVRRRIGFDRVKIYRFDEDWNGAVVGEARNERLPMYLHHRFPAADIPAQARELYRRNRLRLIADANYQPVRIIPAINPATRQPLDMTFSILRSVSPVHVQYMKNMETMSSMSISILCNGKLWGLVACHHREPKSVPFSLRTTCDLLVRIFSLRLQSLEFSLEARRRIEVRSIYAKLLAVMADRLDYAGALLDHPAELLAFADAQGAAALTEGGCALGGQTPPEDDVRRIADWLFNNIRQEVFHTDSLAEQFPPAKAYLDRASGLLAIAVSKLHPSYIIWFRPEVIQTIPWAGDPAKPRVDTTGQDARTLHPRQSFATWKETVREKSLPWRAAEVDAAAELRNSIVGIVLKKAEEMAELNSELERSNKELEAFSYSVSHDLRAPLRHVVGYAEMLRENAADKLTPKEQRCISTIIESSEYAGTLVDKLLAYARLGRGDLQLARVDMNGLARELDRELRVALPKRKIDWRFSDCPSVEGDPMMLRLALRNLFENAAKYTQSNENAVVEFGCRDEGSEHVFHVRDNGVGFDMRYADKLFGVFQRLHRMEDYEGTGIGLANVRRIIERHGGRTWAEGEEGKGATFYFSLPKPERQTE